MLSIRGLHKGMSAGGVTNKEPKEGLYSEGLRHVVGRGSQ